MGTRLLDPAFEVADRFRADAEFEQVKSHVFRSRRRFHHRREAEARIPRAVHSRDQLRAREVRNSLHQALTVVQKGVQA